MQVHGKTWEKGSILLADGAWGTEFFKRGLMQGSPPDEWNLSHPEIVREVTREYLDAGADIVLTNSFGANRFRLEPHGLSDQVVKINAAAASLAREVTRGSAIVAGDMGPSARFISLGEVTAGELYEVFVEQARTLADAGVDWIVVESMTDVEEMAVAVRAASETTHLPVVASMSYNATPRGYRTMMGNPPETCVRRAEEAGASLIGANCGSGIECYVPLAPLLRDLTTLPVWVKANAGMPQIVGGKVVYPLCAEEYASYVPRLVQDGVDVVGGCCGTDPGHIRAIAAALEGKRHISMARSDRSNVALPRYPAELSDRSNVARSDRSNVARSDRSNVARSDRG
jgi:5-methyltetrahydrofolate--homocysteine methyltransferase